MTIEKIRVLQLIDSLDAGGAERMAVNIANALEPLVAMSVLCVTRREGVLKKNLDPNTGYLFLNKKTLIDFKALKKLHGSIRNNQINLIHAHSTSFFYGTIIKILNPKIKLVWHDHFGNRAEETSFFRKLALKICSLFFDQVICVSDALKQWASQHLYCKQITVVFNFSDVSSVILETELKGYQGKRILCLANLRDPKNHLLLIKAFALLHQEYPDWSLHCVGANYNDTYSKEVMEAVREMKLEHAIYFYGLRTDVYAIIKNCEIGVLASTSEGLPMALLEYGLGGLAVVATDVGDCNKVIKDGSMGSLVPSNDYKALFEAILFYINYPKKRAEVGERLLYHIRENFSITQTVNAFTTIYMN